MDNNHSFPDRLVSNIQARNSSLIVGLDPRKSQLPSGLLPDAWGDETDAVAQAYKMFCMGIIDVVADLVPAVKPQMAFFEQLGPAGMRVLRHVINYARERGLLVILDGKRNDIGSTAEAYADAYLGSRSAWGGDALTINPLLGGDSLRPFVQVATERNAGLFVLVKTSNPGGKMFQDRLSDGRPIYEHVGEAVEELANETRGQCGYGAVGAVVGATYPDELAALRKQMPHTWFLVPGMGQQGGRAEDIVRGFDANGLGVVINCSRSIIFAHRRSEYQNFGDSNWQAAVEAATRDTSDQINAAKTGVT